MKKFPHQQFLKDNHIALESLPEMLQKRIRGFDELEDDLQYATDEHRQYLSDLLERLSQEIEEDLEEHFEQELENNDPQEEEEETPEQEKEEQHLEENPSDEVEQKEQEAIEEFEPDPEPVTQQAPPVQEEVAKEPTDEDILQELVDQKHDRVCHLELKQRGFKGNLDNRILTVGKFYLVKEKYATIYKIYTIN